MDDKQYLEMLNEGLNKHRLYLPYFLKREQKKAQREFVSKIEFVNRVLDVLEVLENIAKNNNPVNIVDSKLAEILNSLTLQQKKDLLRDCELLKKSVSEAFEYETVGEPIDFDLKKLAAEEKEINKKKEALYTLQDINKNWFIVGLLFATGEMSDLRLQFKKNHTRIAKHKFGENWKSFRPYISESNSDSKKSTSYQNIFANKSRVEKITQYCKHNDIPIHSYFLSKANAYNTL